MKSKRMRKEHQVLKQKRNVMAAEKAMIKNLILSPATPANHVLDQERRSQNNSLFQLRCWMTGYSRSLSRRTRLSRFSLRKLASSGEIPMLKKR